jgi:hypothetical protein
MKQVEDLLFDELKKSDNYRPNRTPARAYKRRRDNVVRLEENGFTVRRASTLLTVVKNYFFKHIHSTFLS